MLMVQIALDLYVFLKPLGESVLLLLPAAAATHEPIDLVEQNQDFVDLLFSRQVRPLLVSGKERQQLKNAYAVV